MNALRSIETVGFIGLGIMGRHMAGHLLEAGHALHISTRTPATAHGLMERGARWHDAAAAVAAASDVVITMVGTPADVEALYLGPDGLVSAARPGTVLVDMTTSSPSLAARIAEAGAARGVFALDAPVSGGEAGARAGRLSVMIGGNEAALSHVMPLLARMGTTLVHQGPAGAGQHAKMANQIAVANTLVAVCECLAYAERAGLDPRQVLKSVGAGTAGSPAMAALGPRMLDGDFAPGFYVRHFLKDMGIALAEAERMALPLPGVAQARALYDRLAADGHGEAGTQSLYLAYWER